MLQLPVELVTFCLYFADLPTRIRASHISRAWRDIALSERGLWSDFICTTFVTEEDQLRTYEMLKTMLLRSTPLPFRLRIPHSCFGVYHDYESSIASAMGHNTHRLHEYDGPTYVFCQLHLSGESLPGLRTFVCRDHEDFAGSPSAHDLVVIQANYDGLRLPNLRRLVGPVLMFSDSCEPYIALRELVCTLPDYDASQHLFRCCPSLVTAEFLGVRDDSRLPLPPFPGTLKHITLRGEPDRDGEQDGVDFGPLVAWHEHSMPNLTLFGAQSLHYPLSQFLSQCDGPISLRVSPRSPDITLATEDGSRCWEIGICAAFWEPGRLASMLELVADRLAHLSMCIEHIGEFFNARFYAPYLVSLELSLTGVIDNSLPFTASEFYFLRAPGLQHFTLEIGGSDEGVEVHKDYINGVLGSLKRNFRSLLVYEPDLLESITVRSTASVIEDMDFSDLARFARRFVQTDWIADETV